MEKLKNSKKQEKLEEIVDKLSEDTIDYYHNLSDKKINMCRGIDIISFLSTGFMGTIVTNNHFNSMGYEDNFLFSASVGLYCSLYGLLASKLGTAYHAEKYGLNSVLNNVEKKYPNSKKLLNEYLELKKK